MHFTRGALQDGKQEERVDVINIITERTEESILSLNIKAFTDEEKGETSKGMFTAAHIKHF